MSTLMLFQLLKHTGLGSLTAIKRQTITQNQEMKERRKRAVSFEVILSLLFRLKIHTKNDGRKVREIILRIWKKHQEGKLIMENSRKDLSQLENIGHIMFQGPKLLHLLKRCVELEKQNEILKVSRTVSKLQEVEFPLINNVKLSKIIKAQRAKRKKRVLKMQMIKDRKKKMKKSQLKVLPQLESNPKN